MMFLNNNDYKSNSLLNSTNNRFNNSFNQNPQISASFFPSESRTISPQYQGIPDLRNFGQHNPPVDIRNFNGFNNNAHNNNNFVNPYQNNNVQKNKFRNYKNTNLNKNKYNGKGQNSYNKQNKYNGRHNKNNYRKNKNNDRLSNDDLTIFEDLSKVLKGFAKKFIMNFLESKIDDWLDEIEVKVKQYLSVKNVKPDKKETKNKENNINNNFFEVLNIPKQTNTLKETKNEEYNVEPYNTEPFDEPCPLENFNDKIINSTETLSSRLSHRESKEDIENKLNQYKKNYLFGTTNETLSEMLNNMLLMTKSNNISNSLKNDINFKNINIITNEQLNEQNNNFNEEINNEKVDDLNQEEDTNDNDLKKFIYSELLSNFMNGSYDDKLEKTIDNIKRDLIDKNTKKNLQNSDSNSTDSDSENTSSD